MGRLVTLLRDFILGKVPDLLWSLWGPAIMAIIATYLGHLDGLPRMYTMVGAVGAFGLAAWGLNQFSQWRIITGTSAKLQFANIDVGVKHLSNDRSLGIEGIKLGVRWINRGTFPIEMEIQDFRSVVGNKVNPEATGKEPKMLVPALTERYHHDKMILLGAEDLKGPLLLGRVSFKVIYGRPGRLRYPLAQSFEVSIGIKNGDVIGSTWKEVPY